ncbi:MAG: sensor histidine kinase [Bacteroidota bacterium]
MRKPSIIIFAHIAGWLLFFALMNGFIFRDETEQDLIKNILSPSFLIFCFVYLFIFYFNTYILIPQLYFQKRQWLYAASVIILFLLVVWLKPFETLLMEQRRPQMPRQEQLSHNGPPPPRQGHRSAFSDVTGIFLFIAAWSLSTAICVSRQWRMIEQRAVRAEADKANAELSFLKMQINPHFLFNTLNNIYMLAVIKDENTAPGILKLSNIMRYLTDEVNEDLVPLQSEFDCVQDYIDLQKLRLNKYTKVDFTVEGDLSGKQIAPLILMTFVENAFKHGISNHEQSEIVISLLAEKKYITFYCQNKLFETKRNTERIGIGIANVKQRLQYMYAGKHTLTIKEEEGLYSVQLTLEA